MSAPLWGLFAYTVWAFFLLFPFGFWRIYLVLSRQAKPIDFPADKPHGSPLYQRMHRAHQNALENLPIFASLVILSALTNLESSTFNTFAILCVAARMIHSMIHISGLTNKIVLVRAHCFYLQLACYLGMSWILLVSNLN